MRISATVERWPIAGAFTIARGSKTAAEVVVATIDDGQWQGRGECVPYPRYGESVADVAALVNAFDGPFERTALLDALPAGAARNAIDCALWDLQAKRSGQSVWQLAGVPTPSDVTTAYTIGLDAPDAMAQRAAANDHRPLLKVKLGTDARTDGERLRQVRSAAPNARLIVDANEGWNFATLMALMPIAVDANVELIEQPLPATADDRLADYRGPIPIAADESIRDGTHLAATAERYQAINIKLDKTGGLTRALALAHEAQALGLDILVGCMVATSLAMAPALALASFARYVDLDGPLLLSRDRVPGLAYEGAKVSARDGFWGSC